MGKSSALAGFKEPVSQKNFSSFFNHFFFVPNYSIIKTSTTFAKIFTICGPLSILNSINDRWREKNKTSRRQRYFPVATTTTRLYLLLHNFLKASYSFKLQSSDDIQTKYI
jgi:hypothetical protein